MSSVIISILGGKGGVGKSIIASNLAVSLLLDSRKNVLLIEVSPNAKADISSIMGVSYKRSFVDAVNHGGNITEKNVQDYVIKHTTGIDLLPLVLTSTQSIDLKSEQIINTMSKFSNIYEYIVLDAGDEVSSVVLPFLELSTLLLVVSSQDVLAVKHSKLIVEKLQGLMFNKSMMRLVVSKFDSVNPITPQVIQSNVGISVLGAVHDDPVAANNSITKGKSVITLAPKSVLARSIYQLARIIQESGILVELESIAKPNKPTLSKNNMGGNTKATITALKKKIHKGLVENMDLKKMDSDSSTDPNKQAILYEKTKRAVITLLEREDSSVLSSRELRGSFIKSVLDEALALGPLEDLLADESVSEIMINGHDTIYVEKNGKLTLSEYTFTSAQQLMGVTERILAPIGRRIDEKSPYTDARLQDGSRVHAIIPPLALNGPTLTIRKFAKEKLGVPDLVKFGSVTQDIADFFVSAVRSRLNIIISGGTGSGKTTLLNILSSMIPEDERIITVEDSAELQLQQDHVVRLETRPANIEGEGEVSIRDLVKCTLRMRPDRIIVGECRSGESLDMLQAMNTGHDGSLTTIHSNTPVDSMRRLETLVMMAGMDLPGQAIREQIASAVHMVVQQSRLNDGSRKVTYVTEISGMRGGEIILNDIFRYEQTGVDKKGKAVGKFIATGYIPKFIETLEAKGIEVPKGLFSV